MIKKYIIRVFFFAAGISLASCSYPFPDADTLDEGETQEEEGIVEEQEEPDVPSESPNESDLCRDWYGYVDGDGEEKRELILRFCDDYSMTIYMRRHSVPEEIWTHVDGDEFLPVIGGSWSLADSEITVRASEIDLIAIFLLSGNVEESWIESITDPLHSENLTPLGLHDRDACYEMMEYLEGTGYFSLNLIGLSAFLDLFYKTESYDVEILEDCLSYYDDGVLVDCFAPGKDSLVPCGYEEFRFPCVFPDS